MLWCAGWQTGTHRGLRTFYMLADTAWAMPWGCKCCAVCCWRCSAPTLCASAVLTLRSHAVVTGSQLLVILLILILGFWKSDRANMTPFLPFGVEG